MPVDTLSSDFSRRDPTPTRYTSNRRDPKIVQELNHASVKDFLPDSPTDRHSGFLKPSGVENKSLNEHPVTIESDLPLYATPAIKRQKTSVSNALYSPDLIFRKQAGSEVSTSKGTLRLVLASGIVGKPMSVLMTVTDDEGTRFSVRWKGSEIEGSQIDPLRDCEQIYFDSDTTHMGILLKHSRCLYLGETNAERKPIKTKMVIWKSAENPDKRGHLARLKEIFKKGMLHVELVASFDDVLCRMKQMVARQKLEASTKQKYWEKAEFQSLEKRHSRSRPGSNGSGTKILVPEEKAAHEKDPSDSNGIPSTQFYGDAAGDQTPSSPNTLRGHTLSSLRRSTRSTVATTPDNLSLDEPSLAYEKPQPFQPSLFYKFDDNSTLSVTNQDFKCLYNHDWINDSILDFFVKYWIEDAIREGTIERDRVHVLSSFFYTKLISNSEDYYQNVKKWVNNTDLFRKDYIVMPINVSYHWFGCIIENLPLLLSFLERERDYRKKHQNDETKAEDEDSDDISITSPVVSILVYDSLRQTHSREIEPIKEFLIAYAADKYGLEVSKHQIKMKTCLVPQQPNMSDCGVHVILNTRKFFESPKMTLELWKSVKSRGKSSSRTVNEYFDKKARTTARSDLRNVLLDLQQRQVAYNKLHGIPDLESDRLKSDEESHSDIEILEGFEQDVKQNVEAEPKHSESPVGTAEEMKPGEKSLGMAAEISYSITETASQKANSAMPIVASRYPSIVMSTPEPPEEVGNVASAHDIQLERRFLESSAEPPLDDDFSSRRQTLTSSKYFDKVSTETSSSQREVPECASAACNADTSNKNTSGDATESCKNRGSPSDIRSSESIAVDPTNDIGIPRHANSVTHIIDSPSPTSRHAEISVQKNQDCEENPLFSSPAADRDEDIRLISENSFDASERSYVKPGTSRIPSPSPQRQQGLAMSRQRTGHDKLCNVQYSFEEHPENLNKLRAFAIHRCESPELEVINELQEDSKTSAVGEAKNRLGGDAADDTNKRLASTRPQVHKFRNRFLQERE